MSNMLAGADKSTLPVLILSVNRTGVTPDINALTTVIVLCIVGGMLVMNLFNKARAKRQARLEAEG